MREDCKNFGVRDRNALGQNPLLSMILTPPSFLTRTVAWAKARIRKEGVFFS
jgi:hypothetical protein